MCVDRLTGLLLAVQAHESVVGSLRRELRSKEEQLHFLQVHLQAIQMEPDTRRSPPPAAPAGLASAAPSHLDSMLPDTVRAGAQARLVAAGLTTPKPRAAEGPRNQASLSDLIQAFDQGSVGRQRPGQSAAGITWKTAMAQAARDMSSPVI